MREPLPPSIRTGRATARPCPEVARARGLYLRALRARLQDGSYMTPDRVQVALDRLTRAVCDDLPAES